MEKPGVLFLCTANSARSPMAEAFFRRHGPDRFEVASAGLDPTPINPLTVAVMREVGIDLAGRRPVAVKEYLGRKSFKHVVTVCKPAEAACPLLWPFALEQLSWPFDNPADGGGTDEERIARFRGVRDAIEAKVRAWVRGL